MSTPGEAPNLELGTDRFELLRCLGEGAFGVVFEAFDRERESTVALKALHALHGGAIYDLKQEFRGVAGLSHKNLVMVHELFASGPRPFFTMELALGEDFLTYVRPAGNL
ncbi:MAG: protein kinase domain-containing protein, partial [Planctomycetota bacterium]